MNRLQSGNLAISYSLAEEVRILLAMQRTVGPVVTRREIRSVDVA